MFQAMTQPPPESGPGTDTSWSCLLPDDQAEFYQLQHLQASVLLPLSFASLSTSQSLLILFS